MVSPNVLWVWHCWLKIGLMNCGLPCFPLKFWVGEVKMLIAQCCLAWQSEYEYHPQERLFKHFLNSTLFDLWQKYPKKFTVVKTWKYYAVQHQNFSWKNIKFVSATFLLVCFCVSKRALVKQGRLFLIWPQKLFLFLR